MTADVSNSPVHFVETLIELCPVSTALEVPAALTGGESPTEAEHNALLAFVTEVYNDLVTLGLIVND